MSLFSSIQLAKNSLLTAQLGLQVAGNNIANSATPGYLRQEIQLTPAASQQQGDLLLGLGVRVVGITQKVDKFLEERLRGAHGDLANGEAQERTYFELEALIGELADTDLSTSLTNFFASLGDILNQPESLSVRNLAVLQGKTLATDISRLDGLIREQRADVNDRIVAISDEINARVSEVARLNVQIVSQEGGGTRKSDAVGLRDARQLALGDLAKLIDIRTVEQPTGDVTVYTGGEYLVFGGEYRTVSTHITTDRGLSTAEVRLTATQAVLNSASGELAGLIASRDEILGGFIDDVNGFAENLIFEFNKAYSGGQGLIGFSELTSEFSVDNVSQPLDESGLPFTPVNGSFRVQVYNKQTDLTETTDIIVDLDGIDEDTSLEDLVTLLNGVDGLNAELTASRRVKLSTDSVNLQFAFADDTSGVLAALGLNTFFSGSTASDITINESVRRDPSTFATSRSGIGKDVDNALILADLYDAPLDTQNGQSLAVLYERMASETIQASAVATSVAEGFRVFQRTLQGEQLGISGVSIDEEAVRMITYQRMFQASARYISTITDLLDTLVNL